jgi:predicted nucleic acid-binding protein
MPGSEAALYLDTSVIVPLYLSEPRSGAVQRRIAATTRAPVISDLVGLELAAVLSQRVRQRELIRTAALRILELFEEHVSSRRYQRLGLGREHYAAAQEYIKVHDVPLRTVDALHLTVSQRSGCLMVTADRQLFRAAVEIGAACELVA